MPYSNSQVYWIIPADGQFTIVLFIHTSIIVHLYVFASRANKVKMQKIQERALRFVLKDSVSDYESLLSKSGVDSFRISSMKNMAVEINKILNNMGLSYL